MLHLLPSDLCPTEPRPQRILSENIERHRSNLGRIESYLVILLLDFFKEAPKSYSCFQQDIFSQFIQNHPTQAKPFRCVFQKKKHGRTFFRKSPHRKPPWLSANPPRLQRWKNVPNANPQRLRMGPTDRIIWVFVVFLLCFLLHNIHNENHSDT